MAKAARFRNIPVRIFDKFGDVAKTSRYFARAAGAYTPGVKHQDSFVEHGTRAMRYGFGAYERGVDQGRLKSEDFKLGIAGQELPVKPQVNDEILFDTGGENIRVNVERNLTEDPYDAFIVLHVRPL